MTRARRARVEAHVVVHDGTLLVVLWGKTDRQGQLDFRWTGVQQGDAAMVHGLATPRHVRRTAVQKKNRGPMEGTGAAKSRSRVSYSRILVTGVISGRSSVLQTGATPTKWRTVSILRTAIRHHGCDLVWISNG